MDMKIPQMNGFGASAIIKKRQPTIKIPAVSAFSSVDDQYKAIASGCDDIVKKQCTAEELYNLIYKLAGKQV